jgi:hypothetical protein
MTTKRPPLAGKATFAHRQNLIRKTRDSARRRLSFESLERRALLAAITWSGGGGDANWSTDDNWVGSIRPQAGDSLIFPAGVGGTSTNDLAAGTAFNTIEISGSGYAIGGNSIQLAGGLTANNVSGANTVGLDITLNNAQTLLNANPGATLQLTGSLNTGNIIGNYFFGTAPAIIFDGAGTTSASGVISGAGISSMIVDSSSEETPTPDSTRPSP